jgi:ADP-ribose pyrophosphatase YjhB (NUDIX family)
VRFDHPRAGVQLPAGTLLPDEDVDTGALREAFEETGLDDLQFRSELAVLPGAPSVGGVRHVVHIVTESAAPDEWYVTTPDGGGLCWRCHWLDIADSASLNADQQSWLEVARSELLEAKHPPARSRPLVDPDAQTDLTIEVFWAPPWSGTRALVSWLDPAHGLLHLNGERAGRVTTDTLFWVRVETLPFEPAFETHARRELSPAAARDQPLWANPITQRVLALAAEAERRHTS